MVHVPFFNIDLPEPRLGALIPDTVGAVVNLTAKAVEHGKELLHPPTPEEQQAFQDKFDAEIPREFDRVRKRYDEGKIANDEQLSSELEDASFDWYRRQLRTSVVGATDEETDDVALRKLGLAQPSLQAALNERALQEAVEAAGGLDLVAELTAASALAAAQRRDEERRQAVAARAKRIEDLRRQVRPTSRQTLATITNASGGLLLGVLLFKSALLAASKLFRRRKQNKAQQQRRQAAQSQAQAVAAAAAAQRAQAAAAAQQAAAAAAAMGRPQAAASQAAAQQQQQQPAAAGAAAAARKTRTIKKR
ncbi:hypothetical protein HYH03_008123 [Edaphochlamys debaryana]|uniref:Uncharacterized protein n=1 Tax=Edaphochlamys debaryana TaxID=47281 RepID=A0A835Y0F9_9CHLO|nr:hypothetical protein HYH03_008123 [Edaphochlamys debaryana]|eukprot:KAG2493606.1 hypothetical protein HYH03_008123 [Edaphochlamys debaryana]